MGNSVFGRIRFEVCIWLDVKIQAQNCPVAEPLTLCNCVVFTFALCAFSAYLSTVLDKTNKESVRAIQKSIFMVCLDAPKPRVSDEMYHNKVAAQMLHGGGSRWNSGNRWFDKTLQVSGAFTNT